MRPLVTRVLCFRQKDEDMGLKNDLWLNMVIDLDHVIGVKQNGGDEDDENFDKAVLYTDHDYFVIELDYFKALDKWLNQKQT